LAEIQIAGQSCSHFVKNRHFQRFIAGLFMSFRMVFRRVFAKMLENLRKTGQVRQNKTKSSMFLSCRPLFATILSALCLLAQIAPDGARAQDQAVVTPKRIVVNPNQTGPRITVQIDPEEQARALAALPPFRRIAPPVSSDGAVPGPSPSQAWFWERVSPNMNESNGRWLAAMSALDNPPEGAGLRPPRLQMLQDIATAHGPDILRASVGTQVSPALVLAVIAVESAGRAQAVSSAGAQGLMQLIPATATRFGVSDLFDTSQNIRGGVSYLNWLLDHFGQDVVLALAGYNAGEGAVRRNGGVPPFAETRDYVPKVLAAWRVARGLCTTAPELPSDGCVFRVGQSG
jgi:hypothetical protein